MPPCPRCFAPVPPSARFCTRCGLEQAHPAPTRSRRFGPEVAVGAGIVGLAVVLLVGLLVVRSQSAPTPQPAPVAAAQPETTSPDPTGTATTPPDTTEVPIAPPYTGTTSPDPDLVALTTVASVKPSADAVRESLDRFYGAINTHDYDAWSAAVTPAVARSQSRSAWESGYRTTVDDDVTVLDIDEEPGTAYARVSMRSAQDPSDAPSDLPASRICWTLTYPVVDPSSGGRVGAAVSGSVSKSAC